MRPYITGSKPKEERKRAFCIGAKRCSGKAATDEEAAQLCASAIPKWARQALPKEDDNLPCPERIARVHQTIDTITLGLKSGDTEEMMPACARLLSDIQKCRPGEVAELASVVAHDIKALSNRFYLKGEAKDVQNKLTVLKELL
jgi:NAD(P)H-hydrate repair Nnr-like enzyme with NAD(P)H-hydrate dehydratase domain